MDPLVCDSCRARFPVGSFSAEQYAALEHRYDYDKVAEELRLLHNVKAFYQRHPEAEGRIKPHGERVRESEDPHVQEQFFSGVPADQIELPPLHLSPDWLATADDAEVVQYLQHHGVTDVTIADLVLGRVRPEFAQLSEPAPVPVACPGCGAGRLYVDPPLWFEYHAAVHGSITLYWLKAHGFDGDGTLHVRATGACGGEWWTGEHVVAPDDGEYAFFRWLVTQKRHLRLADGRELPALRDEELPALREEWSRLNPSG
jgi:hypothetical protein